MTAINQVRLHHVDTFPHPLRDRVSIVYEGFLVPVHAGCQTNHGFFCVTCEPRRAYPKRGLTLSGEAKNSMNVDSPPKGSDPFSDTCLRDIPISSVPIRQNKREQRVIVVGTTIVISILFRVARETSRGRFLQSFGTLRTQQSSCRATSRNLPVDVVRVSAGIRSCRWPVQS